jgi:hypothetical protein
VIIDPTQNPREDYPRPSEEEETAQLLHALEHDGYDACDFETRDERAERIARTRRYGEARDAEFLGLHRHGFSYDEIARVMSRDTVDRCLGTSLHFRWSSWVGLGVVRGVGSPGWG